ncbi:hypothetical protein PR048_000508 [Dryococelus australis]|uniref:C2H2-type domain-containing protein n=1 Tax=Dryococelus australis TaxID=614101 RepID=A0ABQ9IEU0_9NEOP|nr:hypothetical protein PR048_000508 [Dryococelus australis]
MEQHQNVRVRDISQKTCQPFASLDLILTCKNLGAAPLGIIIWFALVGGYEATEDRYRCVPCGKILTSQQRLRRHIQNVHTRPTKIPGSGGVVVRLSASHLGEVGSIPGRVTPRFLHVGIMPGDAAGRQVFVSSSYFGHRLFDNCNITTYTVTGDILAAMMHKSCCLPISAPQQTDLQHCGFHEANQLLASIPVIRTGRKRDWNQMAPHTITPGARAGYQCGSVGSSTKSALQNIPGMFYRFESGHCAGQSISGALLSYCSLKRFAKTEQATELVLHYQSTYQDIFGPEHLTAYTVLCARHPSCWYHIILFLRPPEDQE